MVGGESIIAGIALAALVIIIATLGLAGWWSARSARAAVDNARYEQARALCDLLARNAESQLGAGELTAFRRELIETSSQNGFGGCRVLLPDGRIIADADPTKITLAALPARWPSGPLDARNSPDGGIASFERSLLIPGRGPALLEVSIDLTGPWNGVAEL